MPLPHRLILVLVALVLLAWTAALGPAADVAYADRCQPEELVLGPGNSPVGHDDRDPRCPVMQLAVYDQVACDDTTFLRCVNSLNGDGTVAIHVQRVRDICLVRDLIGCNLTVGDVLDTAGAGGGLVPTGAVPQGVKDICLYYDLIGCGMTVGQALDRLP